MFVRGSEVPQVIIETDIRDILIFRSLGRRPESDRYRETLRRSRTLIQIWTCTTLCVV